MTRPCPERKITWGLLQVRAGGSWESTREKKISASADMSPLSGVGTLRRATAQTWHYTYDRTATDDGTRVVEKVPQKPAANVEALRTLSKAFDSQPWPRITKEGQGNSGKRKARTKRKHGKNRDASTPRN